MAEIVPSGRLVTAKYMGSFPVAIPDITARAECVRAKLETLRFSDRSTAVLLVISLAGIKVCSPDGKCVQMAHALRRISYATCEPRYAQFSFLAREPRAHFTIQYCHSFVTDSAEQAEELNSIVGNAFRMAYVAQLQRQPILQDVIFSQSAVLYQKDDLQHRNSWSKISSTEESTTGGYTNSARSNCWTTNKAEMNVQIGNSATTAAESAGGLRHPNVKAPNSIPGLRSSHNLLGNIETSGKNVSQQSSSSPCSDESNSPTELNSYKRLTDKPPLIKRLTMGFTGARDLMVLGLDGEDDSCPLVSGTNSPTSPFRSNRPNSSGGGYINEAAIIAAENVRSCYNKISLENQSESIDNTINASINASINATINASHNVNNLIVESNRTGQNPLISHSAGDFKCKRRFQIGTRGNSPSSEANGTTPPSTPCLTTTSGPLSITATTTTTTTATTTTSTSTSTPTPTPSSTPAPTPPPPPLPERTDSLTNRGEEAELRKAPWFQAGIPREITLEVLSQEPEGAFMVRESTSKPGCYALSLRVPREFQPSGIAHYLIMRTNKGYKIKGFTKEFTTLTALITHHSVMPELLPCPLSLSRHNPSFAKTDSSKDFADIDSDPDYNTLADFRKMMADLRI